MKLYYTKGACSLVVRIVMNELGLKCEFESVDLAAKKTEKGGDFLKINPKGAVPVLMLDDKQILTENTAILQYLVDKKPMQPALLAPVGDMKRYHALEWLNLISGDLQHKACSAFFNPAMSAEAKEEIFKPFLKKRFNYIEQHLVNHHYLLGETFSLPDIYLFVVLSWQPACGIDITAWPRLSQYFADIKQRKAVSQSLAQEGLVESNIPS